MRSLRSTYRIHTQHLDFPYPGSDHRYQKAKPAASSIFQAEVLPSLGLVEFVQLYDILIFREGRTGDILLRFWWRVFAWVDALSEARELVKERH